MRSEKNILVQRNSSNENSEFLDFIFSEILILMYRNHEEIRIQYNGRESTLKILDFSLNGPSWFFYETFEIFLSILSLVGWETCV